MCERTHLIQPVVFRSSREDWNLILCCSRCDRLLQPEWGMTTVLVSVVRASRMMVIFTASQEERFHRTPVQVNLIVFIERRFTIQSSQATLHIDEVKNIPHKTIKAAASDYIRDKTVFPWH